MLLVLKSCFEKNTVLMPSSVSSEPRKQNIQASERKGRRLQSGHKYCPWSVTSYHGKTKEKEIQGKWEIRDRTIEGTHEKVPFIRGQEISKCVRPGGLLSLQPTKSKEGQDGGKTCEASGRGW